MNPEKIRELISKNFESITREIDTDNDGKLGKLAYLSLTSKPEAIFRDEIGWMLQKKLHEIDKRYVVAREFKRYDLAILKLSENQDKQEPEELLHLIELKVVAAGIFRDNLKGAEEFAQLIDDDFEKRKEDKDIDETKITSLAITYGVNNTIKNNQYAFVKYAGRHNRFFKKGYNKSKEGDIIRNRIDELLKKKSTSDYKIEKLQIAESTKFIGVGVNMYAYLINQT